MDKVPNKVSVLILTMNEEVNIGRRLEGVKRADEIIVLDSGSSDGTLDMVRKYTDGICARRFGNWAGQLNWALDDIPFRNDGILNVDADEVVTDELAAGPGEIGLGGVGAGAFATSVLLPAIAAVKGVFPVAIVSGTGLSAEHAGKKIGLQYAAGDLDQVLDDSNISAVVIATRHNLHASQTARALAAGKHVFVEKPLALDWEGLDDVARAYAGAQRVLMVGSNRRFSPHAAAAKDLFAGTRRPLTINYRVNVCTLPAGNWVADAEEGGGGILGEVCHFVDLAVFFASSAPRSVFAVRTGGAGALAEDADSVIVTLQFANGCIASIAYVVSGEPSFSKERLEVSGAGRTAIVEDSRRTTLYSESGAETLKTAQDKGHAGEMAAFFQAIRSGRQSVPFDEIWAVTAATLAVEESLRTGRPVNLDNS